jgi:glutamine amidotransferase
MIAIINYGLGNVKAFANVFKKLNIPAKIVNTPDELDGAVKIILPGVGAFDFAMQRLNDSGLRPLLDEMVLIKKVPVLGICVGMQMLAHTSEEGRLPGLGWIDGSVKRFAQSPDGTLMSVPHMGWNSVKPLNLNGLFRGLDEASRFYFLHSYYFVCNSIEEILAVTDYYGEFTSAACSGNVFGVQFHPEKSHEWGIKLLKNFALL